MSNVRITFADPDTPAAAPRSKIIMMFPKPQILSIVLVDEIKNSIQTNCRHSAGELDGTALASRRIAPNEIETKRQTK